MKQKRAQRKTHPPFERVPIYQLARDVPCPRVSRHRCTYESGEGYKYSLETRCAAMGATEAVFLAYEERLQPELNSTMFCWRSSAWRTNLTAYGIAYDLQQVTRSAYADR